jgi:RNA polymerase sigma-70 factor (ECF subfamily)
MTDPTLPTALTEARSAFDELVRGLRPELHRYCARMTGSVIDGEDVVQDALAKAFFQLPTLGAMPELRPWLFRIAHNKSIDYLRRYDRRHSETLDELPVEVPITDPLEQAELTELALSWYLKLTALQRSCVILMDVMGYSMAELSELLGMSLPAIKGALHRGRAALRQRAGDSHADLRDAPGDVIRAPLTAREEHLLAQYVTHFNGRNFDALRDLLADDARLEFIGRTSARGARAVGNYFSNYERLHDWRAALGTVDGRAALLVFDAGATAPDAPATRPAYFILIEWRGDHIQCITDYRYSRHVAELATFQRHAE